MLLNISMKTNYVANLYAYLVSLVLNRKCWLGLPLEILLTLIRVGFLGIRFGVCGWGVRGKKY